MKSADIFLMYFIKAVGTQRRRNSGIMPLTNHQGLNSTGFPHTSTTDQIGPKVCLWRLHAKPFI